MKEKSFYLLIHGDYFKEIPDSNMTSVGIEKIEKLKELLPKDISFIICGTGKKDIQTAKLLNLKVDQYLDIVETGATIIKARNGLNGANKQDNSLCLLPNAEIISSSSYLSSIFTLAKLFQKMVIEELPNKTLIIGGELAAAKLCVIGPTLGSIISCRTKTDKWNLTLLKELKEKQIA